MHFFVFWILQIFWQFSVLKMEKKKKKFWNYWEFEQIEQLFSWEAAQRKKGKNDAHALWRLEQQRLNKRTKTGTFLFLD